MLTWCSTLLMVLVISLFVSMSFAQIKTDEIMLLFNKKAQAGTLGHVLRALQLGFGFGAFSPMCLASPLSMFVVSTQTLTA